MSLVRRLIFGSVISGLCGPLGASLLAAASPGHPVLLRCLREAPELSGDGEAGAPEPSELHPEQAPAEGQGAPEPEVPDSPDPAVSL